MSLARPGDFSPYENSLTTNVYTLMADFSYGEFFLRPQAWSLGLLPEVFLLYMGRAAGFETRVTEILNFNFTVKKSLTVLVPFKEKYFKMTDMANHILFDF
jgi:hypothetical protein